MRVSTKSVLTLSAVTAALCLTLVGCVFFRTAKEPMPFITPVQRKAAHLVVFLPGLGDAPNDVMVGGLVEELSSAPQFDVVVADAHLGYYRNFSVLERLREDVIEPLRHQYDQIWLVGISMGGYGALAYAEEYPNEISGTILLAPYLGEDDVIEAIEETGIKQWSPRSFESDSERERHTVEIWSYLQKREGPPLYIGCGDEDRHMREIRLLRPHLKTGQLLVKKGGHDWKTWRGLFRVQVKQILSPIGASEKASAD